MRNLEEMTGRRFELKQKIAELNGEVVRTEARIVESLIDAQMYEFFNINWRKLDRLIRRHNYDR